jgi:hypothetical protein
VAIRQQVIVTLTRPFVFWNQAGLHTEFEGNRSQLNCDAYNQQAHSASQNRTTALK